MAFENLSAEMQNLLLVEYNYTYKLIIIFGFFLFSLIYLLYWKANHEKPTAFYSVGYMRIILTILCSVYSVLLPLSILMLTPEFAFSAFVMVFNPIYIAILIILLILLLVDAFYFLPTIAMKVGGFDIGDPRVAKAYKAVKGFFKKNGNA